GSSRNVNNSASSEAFVAGAQPAALAGKRRRSRAVEKRSEWAERPASLASQFRKIANEAIKIQIGSQKYTTLRLEAYLRKLYAMALNQDSRAARLLELYRRRFPGEPLPGEGIVYGIQPEDLLL